MHIPKKNRFYAFKVSKIILSVRWGREKITIAHTRKSLTHFRRILGARQIWLEQWYSKYELSKKTFEKVDSYFTVGIKEPSLVHNSIENCFKNIAKGYI